jgi:uncharacterized repeat protein (TIGR01451 family)
MKLRNRRLALGLALLGLVGCAVGLVIAQPSLQPATQPTMATPPTAPAHASSSAPMQSAVQPVSATAPTSAAQPAQPQQLPATLAPPPVINGKEHAAGEQGIHPVYTEAAGQPAENTTSRSEPAISLEWIGPATAKVGQAVTYQLIVKNISLNPVQQVMVHATIPAGATVNAAEPKGKVDGNTMSWEMGTMEPRQEKRVDLQLTPTGTGTIPCQATVTLTGTSTTQLRVYEPKLAIKAAAPEKVIVGDPATVGLTVTNPGDAIAEHVKVVANLSEGLEHARGNSVEFDLGNLAPNETRTVYVLCGAKEAGSQKCEATASAEPKLVAHDSATVDVLVPKIDLTVTGPGLRYLDRHAIYTFRVSNPGTAAASQVRLLNEIPQGFAFAAASADGRHVFVSGR